MRIIAAAVFSIAISGCATNYQEPTSGERARLRLVKTGLNASTFFSTYPVVRGEACLKTPTSSQRIALLDNRYAEQGRSLGIPGNDALSGKRFSETYIRSGAPVVLDAFSIAAELPVRSKCHAMAVWAPEAGADYEATLNWVEDVCQLTISVVAKGDGVGVVDKRPADAEYLKACEK